MIGGICENFYVLNKELGYTVCAIRRWITELNNNTYSWLVSNVNARSSTNGGFAFEPNPYSGVIYSFGKSNQNKLEYNKELFSYQTSVEYNGISIVKGSSDGYDKLAIFKNFPLNIAYYCSNAAIYALEIYNRDLSEEEIAEVKKKMIEKYEKETGEKYIES